MALWKPDPSFYPSPLMAMEAPREKLAYVCSFNPNGSGKPDAYPFGFVHVSLL